MSCEFIDYTAVATVHEYHVEFVAYAINGTEADRKLLWEPYLHGDVKWDGCSNWHSTSRTGWCCTDAAGKGPVLGHGQRVVA